MTDRLSKYGPRTCPVRKWPLTLMFLNGHETYPMLIADCLPFGIKPWDFDVQKILTELKLCGSV